jgi:hypothetical protein
VADEPEERPANEPQERPAKEPEKRPVGNEQAVERQSTPEGHALDAGLLGWAIGFGLATFGLAAGLEALGVPWKITLAWTLLSWGILVTLEPELISILLRPQAAMRARKGKIKASSSRADKSGAEGTSTSGTQGPGMEGQDRPGQPAPAERHEPLSWIGESPLLRRTSFRRVLELVLIISLAELGFVGSRAMHPTTPAVPPTVKLSDADESALRKCLDHLCDNGSGSSGPANGAPSQTTVRMEPELEKALTQFLEKQQKQDQGGSTFPWGVAGFVVVVLIVAAIIVAGRVAKEHPSTAAPLGAAGLAGAAIKGSEHLSRLSPITFYGVLVLFAAAGVFAVIFGWRQTRRGANSPVDARVAGEGNRPARGKMVESPMNTLFSFAILLWAVIMVCYRVPGEPVKPPPPPASTKVTMKMLPAIRDFSAYSQTVPNQEATIASLANSAVANGARGGDLLILLGSADCRAIHAPGDSNSSLAKRRADAVRNLLLPRNLLDPENILADSLYQHEQCRESGDVRAVFPVLVHVGQ